MSDTRERKASQQAKRFGVEESGAGSSLALRFACVLPKVSLLTGYKWGLLGVGTHVMVRVVIQKFKLQYTTMNLYRVNLK